jgi:hypothetical protein
MLIFKKKRVPMKTKIITREGEKQEEIYKLDYPTSALRAAIMILTVSLNPLSILLP